MISTRHDKRPVDSCVDCLWGPLWWHGRCVACYAWDRAHDDGACQGCHRTVALRDDFCRLCWREASRRANLELITTGVGIRHCGPLLEFLQQVDSHQLFFTTMEFRLRKTAGSPANTNRVLSPPEPFQAPFGPGQTPLFDLRHDLTRVRTYLSHRLWMEDALAVPHIARAWHAAGVRADALGWSARILAEVRGALLTALCCRPPDEPVYYSELHPLAAARAMPVERTATVLADIGLFRDDRPGALENAFDRHLGKTTPAIRADTEDWLRALVNGTSRTKARSRDTGLEYLRVVAPILTAWSADHDHLREVTTEDIRAALAARPAGRARSHTLVALRSLFRYLRGQRRIFRNPTSRLGPGRVARPTMLPSPPEEYRQIVATASTPEHRLALALAAVHAARPSDIIKLQLDDVDLGDRRITLGGHIRRLDDLTYQVIGDYLVYRRGRWPNTANPHVLVSQNTAYDTRPVTAYFINKLFHGHKGTLDRLRMDRYLEEALTRGPDPLHLTAVFGISETTAMHYAQAARTILESEHDHAPN